MFGWLAGWLEKQYQEATPPPAQLRPRGKARGLSPPPSTFKQFLEPALHWVSGWLAGLAGWLAGWLAGETRKLFASPLFLFRRCCFVFCFLFVCLLYLLLLLCVCLLLCVFCVVCVFFLPSAHWTQGHRQIDFSTKRTIPLIS